MKDIQGTFDELYKADGREYQFAKLYIFSDAIQTVLLLCIARGNRGAVEQAESHRPRGLGVVSGWPRRDERVGVFAGHHLVDCQRATADAA